MKEPIEPSEIRKGDLIRLERTRVTRPAAFEYRAWGDGDQSGWFESGDVYYLLDRPEPAVKLPTEPTLGWLAFRDTDYPSAKPVAELGEWKAREDRATVLDVHGSTSVPLAWVTAFTPATAVPTSALDDLRENVKAWDYLDPSSVMAKFLAAIDKAATS